MNMLLVELPDGTLTRMQQSDMRSDTMVVFDGPDAFESTNLLQRELEKAIEAAGGLSAWRLENAAQDR